MLAPVFLVVPPQIGLLDGFANGVISLANYVRRKLPDIQLELIDLGTASPEEVDAAARWASAQAAMPPIVGITTTTASYQSALQVARAFRRRRRDALIVLGGHHATVQADVILTEHTGLVDVVVHGEGEIALLQLVTGRSRLWSVPGITFVDEAGDVRKNRPAPLLSPDELDDIAPSIEGSALRSPPGKFDHITYVSARGCPLPCAFCSVANQTIRSKSVPAVIRDLRHLVGELGFRRIAIEDNFFAHSRKRTLELCDAIVALRRELSFSWDCQTRVESMNRAEILPAMERAGCEAVYLGVESLCEEQLLYLGKTKSPAKYLEVLQESVVPALVDSAVGCYINLQLGLPGEAEFHRDASLRRLRVLGTQARSRNREITVFPQLHVVYPGTRHFFDAVDTGRFGQAGQRVFEDFTRWEADQQPVLNWLGEHFAHGVGGIPVGILVGDDLRNGRFKIDPDCVLGISTYLRAIEEIEGIRLFKYGTYLAKAPQHANRREHLGGSGVALP